MTRLSAEWLLVTTKELNLQDRRQRTQSKSSSDSVSEQDRVAESETHESGLQEHFETGYSEPNQQTLDSQVKTARYQFTDDQIDDLTEWINTESDPDPDDLFEALVTALEERQKLRDYMKELDEFVNFEAVLEDPSELEEILDE